MVCISACVSVVVKQARVCMHTALMHVLFAQINYVCRAVGVPRVQRVVCVLVCCVCGCYGFLKVTNVD